MKNRVFVLMIFVLTATSLAAQSAQSEKEAVPTVVRRPIQRIATDATTTGQLPKFADGSGTLTDSIISEVNGQIGIGTTDPKTSFHLYSVANTDVYMGMGTDPSPGGGPAFNLGYSGYSFGRGSGFINVRPDASATAPNPSLRFLTLNLQRMIITNTGNVGINITEPAAGKRLHVVGDVQFTGNLVTSGSITGGTVLGAVYQDVAEWVPASSDMTPGTVVVLNLKRTNEVMPSSRRYDTAVAGVVSFAPGIILGVAGDTKEQIATTGRVKVRVDARETPISVGDLLVTSDVSGTAMRSEPMDINGRQFHQPGTIIGKALEPLEGGVGEILVLLSMQ